MIFDKDKKKNLRLEITESNIDRSNVIISARFDMGTHSISFPGKILNDFISIDVPALKDFGPITDGKLVIEAISDSSYMVSYSTDFEIKQEVKMESKLISEEEKTVPTLETHIVESEKIIDTVETKIPEKLKQKIPVKDKFTAFMS